MAAIETEGLTRLFGDRRAVDGVSMTVPDHSVYGVLGRNGAGKTTTMKMLTGLLRPSSGVARVCGVDVVKDRRGAARKIGALLEAHGFYGHLSGRENLDLTRRLLGLATTEVDRVLDVVDMTRDGGRRVGDYSLGMRQRLGIARALLGSPPVLMLDEPTNGLDPDGIATCVISCGNCRSARGRRSCCPATCSARSNRPPPMSRNPSGSAGGRGRTGPLKAELAPEIGLRVDDPARARAVLRSRDLTLSDDADGLVAQLRPGDNHDQVCAALNRDLVAAGVASSLSARARPRSRASIAPPPPSPEDPSRSPSDVDRSVCRSPEAEPFFGSGACGDSARLIAVFVFSMLLRSKTPSEWDMWIGSGMAIWAYFMMPLCVAALTALVAHMEHGPRSWDHLRALPVPRWTLYAAKAVCVIALVLIMSAAVLGATIGAVALGGLIKPEAAAMGALDLTGYAWSMARMAAAALLMIAIQFWTAIRFASFVPGLALGIGGTFFAVVAHPPGKGCSCRGRCPSTSWRPRPGGCRPH